MSKYYQQQREAFKEFLRSSKTDWIDAIRQEFPGKKSEKIIAGKRREGLDIFPVYVKEDLPEKAPMLPRLKQENLWRYHEYIPLTQQVNVRQYNAHVLEALHTGASGLDFFGSGSPSPEISFWKALLQGVHTQHCYISFYSDGQAISWLEMLQEIAEDKENLKGAFYLNYQEQNAAVLQDQFEVLANLFSKTHLPHYQLLGIHSASLPYAGQSVVQELSYVLSFLAELLDHLTDQAIMPERILNNLEITLSTQPNFYLDVAKYRALRLLLTQMAAAYQVKREPYRWSVKSLSAKWNKTVYEPVGNIVRNTTEAMAAIMGGCNAITLLPHDFSYQKAGAFGQRMARHVSNILQEEAHLDKVNDLVAGSYFLENLTHQMVQKAWQEFVALEASGGYLQAMDKGILQQQSAEALNAKAHSVRVRQQIFTGTSRYVNERESVDVAVLTEIPDGAQGPALYESIRLALDAYVNRGNPRPTVDLLVFPEPAKAAFINARVSFIKDLLASVGLAVSEQIIDKPDLSENLEQNLYVLCGSTQFYDQKLPEWLSAAQLSSDVDYWLAGLPESSTHALQQLGIRGFIHAGADVYAILLNMIEKKGITL